MSAEDITTPANAPDAQPEGGQTAAQPEAPPVALTPEVAPWNGELPGLDSVLGLAPDNVRESLRAGIAATRANMDRLLSDRMTELAKQRQSIAAERQRAAEEYRSAKEAARKWALSVENSDVQSVLEALQVDAEGQVEELRARAEYAESQVAALEARQKSIVDSVTQALQRQYDEKYAPIIAAREAERAELEAARARQREAEAAQEALLKQQEAEAERVIMERLVAAAEAAGAAMPARLKEFRHARAFLDTAAQDIEADSGVDLAALDDKTAEPVLDKAIAQAARMIAGLYPKPKDAPNPNAVRPPPVAETVATQGRSGSAGAAPPRSNKPQMRIY